MHSCLVGPSCAATMAALLKLMVSRFNFLNVALENKMYSVESEKFKVASTTAAQMIMAHTTKHRQLSTEEATAMILEVTASPILQEHKTNILEAIEEKVSSGIESTEAALSGISSNQTQSFMFMENYLTQDDWNVIMDREQDFIQVLRQLACRQVKLGCTNPNEKSCVATVSIACVAVGMKNGPDVLAHVRDFKYQLKMMANIQKVGRCDSTFPTDPQVFRLQPGCACFYQNAFGELPPIPSQLFLEDLEKARAVIPARCSKTGCSSGDIHRRSKSQSELPSLPNNAMMAACWAMLQQSVGTQNGRQHVPQPLSKPLC